MTQIPKEPKKIDHVHLQERERADRELARVPEADAEIEHADLKHAHHEGLRNVLKIAEVPGAATLFFLVVGDRHKAVELRSVAGKYFNIDDIQNRIREAGRDQR